MAGSTLFMAIVNGMIQIMKMLNEWSFWQKIRFRFKIKSQPIWAFFLQRSHKNGDLQVVIFF